MSQIKFQKYMEYNEDYNKLYEYIVTGPFLVGQYLYVRVDASLLPMERIKPRKMVSDVLASNVFSCCTCFNLRV